jgi:type IV pilus assembly protein PilC
MNTYPQSPTLSRKIRVPRNLDKPIEFHYTAVRADRQVVRGLLKAHTRRSAQEQLLLRYAHLLELDEEVQDQVSLRALVQGRRSAQSLPTYVRSIAVMFEAGLPLVRIFETAAQGEDDHLNKVMIDVSDSLKRGRTLSNSLARWGSIFDSTIIGMVYSAEQSGRLHKTFGQLADLLEKRWRIEKRVKSAMSYPILVSVVALAIFWILVAYVVPQLVPSFTSVGVELPWLTRALLQFGNLSTSVPVLLGASLTFLGLSGMAYQSIIKGQKFPRLALFLDQLKFAMPVFGELFRLAALSRTLSTVSAMMSAGLPLTKVIEIGGKVSGSPVYEKQFERILERVQEGDSLASAMEGQSAFPPLVVGVTRMGEEAGKTPFLMSKVAALYEEDLDVRVASLASLVEPLIMAVVGLVVGLIVVGTFLPMIQLIQQL